MTLSNKGMLTAKFNRKTVTNPIHSNMEGVKVTYSLCNKGKKSVEKQAVDTPKKVLNISSSDIEDLKEVFVYQKPHKVRFVGNYHDDLRSKHRTIRLGNRYLEIPKAKWSWDKTEMLQFVKYVDTLCKIVLAENGYCNYKAVTDFMSENHVRNFDDNICRQVIGWWSSSPSVIPNRKKVVRDMSSCNTVRYNHNHFGYESTYKGTYRTRDIMKMVADEL